MSIEYVVLKNNLEVKFTINEFNRMTEAERDSYKGNICCPKCKGDAGYRKASKDGKVACFFAKHIDGCIWSTSNESDKKEDGEDTNKVEVDTSTFGIRWNYKVKKSTGIDVDSDSDSNEEAKNKLNYVKDPSKKTQAKLTLNKILTYAEINKLVEARIEMSIDRTVKDLSEIVYHVSEIEESLVGEKAFFWGEMKYYKGNFINLRNANDVSIFIVDSILKSFEERYKDKYFEVQKSNLMILFGKVIKSKNDKYLIVLDDNNKFYFRAK